MVFRSLNRTFNSVEGTHVRKNSKYFWFSAHLIVPLQKMSNKKSEVLLGMIRGGQPMTGGQKLNLIVQLSIPSILAQITSVMMFFIDQAMVGRISVEAAAACGLVESSTWLCGSMTSAASMGFSVQVAHFIGANDFDKARDVFRHGLLCTLIFSLCIMVAGLLIAPRLPYWLGGGADIAADATTYISVFYLGVHAGDTFLPTVRTVGRYAEMFG